MNGVLPTGILRVESPHYVAGSIWMNGRCIEAAPVIRWMVGKSWLYVRRWLHGKGREDKRYQWVWLEDKS